MKILHLADLHLGKTLNSISLIEDQRYFLNSTLTLCKEENIKHIIISGDIYDRSLPNEEAVSLLNEYLSSAVLKEHLKVFIISGNHDSSERLGCFNSLLEYSGLYIDTSFDKDFKMKKHVISEDGVTVNIYSFPYIYPGQVRVSLNDQSIKNYQSSVEKILSLNPLNKEEINILNTHFFVTGDKDPERSSSESSLMVGDLEKISYKVFGDFDYVALGHLHQGQSVGKKTVRYAGSPLVYHVDEIKQKKTVTIIDIKDKEHIEVISKDIIPLHECVILEDSVDNLMKNPEIKDERFVYFNLTDDAAYDNVANKLKTKYTRYLGINYINIKKDFLMDDISLSKDDGFNELPVDKQFDIFYKFSMGSELSEYQRDIIEKIIKEEENK